MEYKLFLRKDETKGLCRSKRNSLCVLNSMRNGAKYEIHNIFVGRTKKVALCQDNVIKHIVTRKAYQEYITPELPLQY